MGNQSVSAALLAAMFAAERYKDQCRRDAEATPHINYRSHSSICIYLRTPVSLTTRLSFKEPSSMTHRRYTDDRG
jgi:hypothetical protein